MQAALSTASSLLHAAGTGDTCAATPLALLFGLIAVVASCAGCCAGLGWGLLLGSAAPGAARQVARAALQGVAAASQPSAAYLRPAALAHASRGGGQ